MKKYPNAAYILFAISSIAFGVIEMVTGNFNTGLLPVPASLPGRFLMAYISGFVFIIFGSGLFLKKWRFRAAFFLGMFYFLFFILVHLQKLFGNIYDPGEWTATSEILILCSGAFFIVQLFSDYNFGPDRMKSEANIIFQISRYAFALSFIILGILHFNYGEYISMLIPSWIPGKLFLAYFIGAAFIATAISIVLKIKVPLSSGLTGIMFLAWVIILHAPRVVSKMNIEAEWTSLFVALASSGASFMLSCLSIKKESIFNMK